MVRLFDEHQPSPRYGRTVHISEAVAKVVENACRANGAVAVSMQGCGDSDVTRQPAEIPSQFHEGQVDNAVQAVRPVPSGHNPNLSVSTLDASNGIGAEKRDVGKAFQGRGKNGHE